MKTVTLILADECDEVVSLTTFGTCKEDGKPKITTAAFSVKNGDVVRFPEDISIITPEELAEKRDEEHTEYLSDMGTDMGVELCTSEDERKLAVDYCEHMVGLDYKRPYKRHGKLFYKPYRNYWGANPDGEPILDKHPRFLITREADRKGVWYTLTTDGLKWLGRQLKITIKC